MARPIRPTPPIIGEEADQLAAELEQVASPEEIRRRREASRQRLKLITTPFEERKKKAESK
jgi:hypothetical protein